jgi:hypothetical protein
MKHDDPIGNLQRMLETLQANLNCGRDTLGNAHILCDTF